MHGYTQKAFARGYQTHLYWRKGVALVTCAGYPRAIADSAK